MKQSTQRRTRGVGLPSSRIAPGMACAAALAAAHAWAGSALAQHCGSTCNLPSVPLICQMNENGGNPTAWVTAGADGGADTEVRHGTRLAGFMPVTHVCVALRNSAGPTVRISFRPPDPANNGLPHPTAEFFGQTFPVNPTGNFTQTFELAQPIAIGGTYWLTAEYKYAQCGGIPCQPGTGHQGVRERLPGSPRGATYIHNPEPPQGPWSGIDGWYWNDAFWLPQWMEEMVPIIRAFSFGCAICPVGSNVENEACGSDVNNGCDGSGLATTLFCNSTMCGTLWRDGPAVDVDWYALDVVDLHGTGASTITIAADCQTDLEIRVQNDLCPGMAGYIEYALGVFSSCEEGATLAVTVPAPGSYFIVVNAADPLSLPPTGCISPVPYAMHVDVDTCFNGPSNSWCSSADPVGYVQQMPFNNIDAVTDGPRTPGCGFNGVDDSDVWFEFTATVDGNHVVRVEPTGPPMDRHLAVYHSGCPQAGFPLLGCDSVIGQGPASVNFMAFAGETLFIRVGTPLGAAGQNWFLLTIDTFTPACPADLNGNGFVDVLDLLILLSAWGICPNPNNCPADLNGNGVVDVQDLLILLSNWGQCP